MNKYTKRQAVDALKKTMKVLSSEKSVRILSICALTIKLITDVRALITENERRIGFKK